MTVLDSRSQLKQDIYCRCRYTFLETYKPAYLATMSEEEVSADLAETGRQCRTFVSLTVEKWMRTPAVAARREIDEAEFWREMNNREQTAVEEACRTICAR
jgi:hypothetical protein